MTDSRQATSLASVASLRQRWADPGAALGCWLSLGEPAIAEAAALAGFDYVCIDLQHGLAAPSELRSLVQAILLGGSAPVARVSANEVSAIEPALDAGVHGVIVPMVNTAEEARVAVGSCRYPPNGTRSWGPTMGRIRGGYLRWARENVVCIPMIETAEGVANIEEIVAVAGVDGVYVGPSDLSLSLGLDPGQNDGQPAFDAALCAVVAACVEAGTTAGVHANADLAKARVDAGFAMVTVAHDLAAVVGGITQSLDSARSVS